MDRRLFDRMPDRQPAQNHTAPPPSNHASPFPPPTAQPPAITPFADPFQINRDPFFPSGSRRGSLGLSSRAWPPAQGTFCLVTQSEDEYGAWTYARPVRHSLQNLRRSRPNCTIRYGRGVPCTALLRIVLLACLRPARLSIVRGVVLSVCPSSVAQSLARCQRGTRTFLTSVEPVKQVRV
jgi:hypothetical protein